MFLLQSTDTVRHHFITAGWSARHGAAIPASLTCLPSPAPPPRAALPGQLLRQPHSAGSQVSAPACERPSRLSIPVVLGISDGPTGADRDRPPRRPHRRPPLRTPRNHPARNAASWACYTREITRSRKDTGKRVHGNGIHPSPVHARNHAWQRTYVL